MVTLLVHQSQNMRIYLDKTGSLLKLDYTLSLFFCSFTANVKVTRATRASARATAHKKSKTVTVTGEFTFALIYSSLRLITKYYIVLSCILNDLVFFYRYRGMCNQQP